MPDNEPPPLLSDLPPPLPVSRPVVPMPQLIKTVAVAQPLAEPVVPAPSPIPTVAPAPDGKLWWVWCLVGAFACLVLFVICLSCNPATTATDRALGKLQGMVAQQLDPQLHPLLSCFVVCMLLPAGCSLLSAAIGHLVFMLGGAPGGWRSTWQNFGLHRLICDAGSLLVIALALMVPMEPTSAASVLIVFLPAIRVGSMITLWVLLARSHGFGPVRVIFFGLPSIFFVSICSGFLAFILALYFYAYLVARSF